MTDQSTWDIRFLRLAREIAQWSKDPSTQVGAVIVRPDRSIAATGFNGFPQRMRDRPAYYENREQKYSRIIHAEMNALHFCRDHSLHDYTLYTWPLLCCERCAVHVIQSGVNRVVSLSNTNPRWVQSLERAGDFLKESHVSVRLYREDVLLPLNR